jgi:DNA adenine methylase
MLYLGGKGRTGRAIAAAILANTPRRGHLLEPFVGGGNTFKHLAPHFSSLSVGDIHVDLMLMWEAAACGWKPPTSVTEHEYAEARKAPPSALRSFIGFGSSYGGKWWGGYARNKVVGMNERSHPDYYVRLASKDVVTIGALMTRADRRHGAYKIWSQCITTSTIVYADPPYANTTTYRVEDFDHDDFWRTMGWWGDMGAHVFVSEYNAPAGWRPIWSKDQRRKVSGGTGQGTTERLFVRE